MTDDTLDWADFDDEVDPDEVLKDDEKLAIRDLFADDDPFDDDLWATLVGRAVETPQLAVEELPPTMEVGGFTPAYLAALRRVLFPAGEADDVEP